MTRKTWAPPSIFWTGIEPAEMDVSSSDTRQKEGDNLVWGGWLEDMKRKRQSVEPQPQRYKDRSKLTSSILGVGSEKGPYTRCKPVKTKQANKHIRTRKYRKRIQSLSLLSLSSHDMFRFAQLTWSTQLSYSLSFSQWLLTNCSSE